MAGEKKSLWVAGLVHLGLLVPVLALGPARHGARQFGDGAFRVTVGGVAPAGIELNVGYRDVHVQQAYLARGQLVGNGGRGDHAGAYAVAYQVHDGAKRCAAVHLRRFYAPFDQRSEEHTSELQSLMRISYAVFCLKKKTKTYKNTTHTT